MTKFQRVVMLLMILAALIPLCNLFAQEPSESIPPIIYSGDPNRPYPVWVESGAAMDSKGHFLPGLFHEAVEFTLEDILSQPPDPELGCVVDNEHYTSYINLPDRDTLEASIRNSSVVFLGVITDKAYGLHGEAPGQLFGVKPRLLFKGELGLDSYYAFIPIGRFSVGSFEICKSDSRYPEPPEPGDEILLMLPFPKKYSDDPMLDLLEGKSVIVVGKDGALSLPRSFSTGDHAVPNDRAELIQLAARSSLAVQRLLWMAAWRRTVIKPFSNSILRQATETASSMLGTRFLII